MVGRRCERAARAVVLLGICGAIPGCYDGSNAASTDGATDGALGSESGEAPGGSDDGSSESGEPPQDTGALPEDPDFPEPGMLGRQGLRRQTIAELRATLADLLQIDPVEIGLLLEALPADSRTPFDNDYRIQEPSAPLVEGMVSIIEALSAQIISDPSHRDALLSCSPSGPADEACLRQFIEHFGRRALRRPLDPSEVDTYAGFISAAEEDDDFNVAFELVLQALLLDGEFLYVVETGEPTATPGVVRLGDFEMASRLSFLLWGRGPSDALLDRAAAGGLDTPAEVREAALTLMDDPRATEQLQRLHAMWLSYDELSIDPTLAEALRAESDALVGRAIEDGAWTSLFTAEETYLDATLAEHYDIPLPGGAPGWVPYPDARRGGLLSHGAFLAIGRKFSDTSPTERGKAVWTRLLCRDIPPPPPDVDSGLPPEGGSASACKPERYDMRENVECATCHEITDGIGFGLENYGPTGEWRTTEPGNPDCRIEGYGEVPGEGSFAGARGLGQTLLETGALEGCFMQHYYQFAIGRTPDADDEAVVAALSEKFESSDDLRELIVTFVSSEAFSLRVLEEAS